MIQFPATDCDSFPIDCLNVRRPRSLFSQSLTRAAPSFSRGLKAPACCADSDGGRDFTSTGVASRADPSSGARWWYDAGMTRAKIAISLPKDQLARVHREVRAGRADSVSGYIAGVLAEHEKRESLQTLLRDLIAQYGEPAAKDIQWAERALAPRRG